MSLNASINVSWTRAVLFLKFSYCYGKNIPVSVIISPGEHYLVLLPLAIIVNDLGMLPIGT